MHLSRRLQRVAANVLSNGVVADIGCDHGFTSIELIRSHRAARAIAMDIGEGPLAHARENVRQYGLTEQISLRLSDGAEKLVKGEADTILISGMGGALICRILRKSSDVVCTAKEWVLSPQSELPLVRKCIHDLGFSIAAEEMVLDQGKYYFIMRAVPGQESYGDALDYLYGKKLPEGGGEVFQAYIEKEISRVRRVLKQLELQKLSQAGQDRTRELEAELSQLEAVRDRMAMEK